MIGRWVGGMVGFFMASAVAASAADLGRQVVAPQPAPSGPVPVVKSYQEAPAAMGSGMEVDLDWTSASWDVGDGSFADKTWSPQLSLSYAVSDIFDIRFAARYMALDDDPDAVNATSGDISPAMDILRLGIGTRAWIPTGSDFMPYAGLLLNYYGFFNGDDVDSIDGTLGVSGEAGVAYAINEMVAVRAGVQFEQTLMDAEGDVGGSTEDISVSGIGFGIGAIVKF